MLNSLVKKMQFLFCIPVRVAYKGPLGRSEHERRIDELTTLVMQLADRLEICSRMLGKCAERKGTK